MNIHFLKVAEVELDDAFNYYESLQKGLGFRFLSEIKLSIKRVESFPTSYNKIGLYSRRCLVQKFPFSIIYQYTEDKNEILIVAISHLHRKPDYWTYRE